MSWTIPFWYSDEKELEKNSIGSWINSLISPTVGTLSGLLILIFAILVIGYIIARKAKVL